MIKTRHYILRLTPEQEQLLCYHQQEAAKCWNYILDVARTWYEATHGKWIGKNELQKWTKGRFDLQSHTVQALVDKFVANRQTIANLRRSGDKKARYPYCKKKYLTIPFKKSAITESKTGSVVLTLSAGVRFDTRFVPPGSIDSVHTCEIIWRKGRYILAYTMEFPEEPIKENGFKAGVDMGEIHPVAICVEDGEALVISGREIRSIKQWRNKALAVLSKKISKCRKGSRQYRKYVRAKRQIMSKSDNQIRNLIHHATRKAIDFCEVKGICELVIGDPENTARRTRKDRKLNKHARQKVGQWEYGRIRQYLKYKAREKGIRTCSRNEENTSKECPVCGSLNYPQGRNYRCKSCGWKGHRDVSAAFAILRRKYRVPAPEFRIHHKQSISKYRKSACVVGPGVVQGSSAIARPLCMARSHT